MKPNQEVMWRQQLTSAEAERDEIECKLYLDHCPPWVEDELRVELRWREYKIYEARTALGLKEPEVYIGRTDS